MELPDSTVRAHRTDSIGNIGGVMLQHQEGKQDSRIIRHPEEDLAHIIIRHLEDGRRRMIRHPGDGHSRIIRGLEEDLHRIIIKDPAEDQMGILHSKNEERDL